MTELTEQQKVDLTQAAQVAGARDDGFGRLLADAFAEAERLQEAWGKETPAAGESPKVESKLTVAPKRDIV